MFAVAGLAMFAIAGGGADPGLISREAVVPAPPTYIAVAATNDTLPALRYSFELSSLTRETGN